MENLRDLKLKLKPYSGLNSELYLRYVNNIELFGESRDETFLRKALDNAHELQLYGSEDFQDVIDYVAIEGKRYLNDSDYLYSYVNDSN